MPRSAAARLPAWPFRWGPARRRRTEPPRRVGYALWRFPAPSETFVRRELRGLRDAGIDVHVIADAGDEIPGDPDLAWTAGRVHRLLPITGSALARDLARSALRHPLRLLNLLIYTFLRRHQADASRRNDLLVFLKSVRLAGLCRELGIEHLHAPWGDGHAFLAMLAARQVDAGSSLQFRAHDLHRCTSAYLLAEKIRHADFVVTEADYNLRKLEALSPPGDHAKLHRVRDGLPLARFDGKPRPPRGGGPLRLLSVARLIEPKGLVHLLGACRRLADRGVAFRCLVIGGPELPTYADAAEEIRRVRSELGLEELVELVGTRPFDAVLDAYRDADVFVLPCVRGADGSQDITPNALLEAMAMRLPVVTTDITALPEVVEDGVSGLLVPPGDPAALEAAILRLAADAGLARRLGEAARLCIEERFDLARTAPRLAALFEAAR